jgi:hypothetical protein
MRFFFGQYPFSVEPVQTYDIISAGSIPANLRITYNSFNVNETVLLRIFYTQPRVVEVFADGTLIPPLKTYPTHASPKGANVLDPQLRKLFLVLRGHSSGITKYDLRTTNVIQLTMTVTMSEADFAGVTIIENLA